MGIVNYTYNRSTSGGEIITHLINSTDGAGLHFDGAAGYIDIASPPDLGTKFSFEFIVQADSWGSADRLLIDFKSGSSRFQLGSTSSTSYNLGIFTTGGWANFGVKVLDDLKVHHVVVTVDGTSLIAYDNGNQVGTLTAASSDQIDAATDANIGRDIGSGASFFDGNLFRTRFWNKTLSPANITELYENAALPFADQWGSQTIVVAGDFTGNLDGWDAFNNWNSQTNPSNNMVLAASGAAQICRTSTALTAGKRYRCTYTASSVTDAPVFAFTDGSYTAITAAAGSSTITAGTNSFEFIWPAASTNDLFYILSVSATAAVTLDDISVVAAGCVADYDLAMANPAISTTVQNRNDTISADGTASSTGVTQITKIEQVNVKALAVGADVGAVADGQVSSNSGGQTNPLKLGQLSTYTTSSALSFNNAFTASGLSGIWGGDGSLRVNVPTGQGIGCRVNDATITSVSSTGLAVTGAVSATGIVKSTGTPGLSAATTSEAILASEGGYGAFIYGSGTTYDVTLGRRNTAVALGVLADTINLVAPGTLAVTGLSTFANGINLGDSTLEDYKEGVQVVTMTAASGTITLNGAVNTGQYTRIGRMVYYSGQLSVSSVSSPTGAIRITLPYTVGNTTDNAERSCGVCYVNGASSNNGNGVLTVDGGNTTAGIVVGVATNPVMQASAEIYFSISYIAA